MSDLYSVSDGLNKLKAQFAAHRSTGVSMNSAGVVHMEQTLAALAKAALALEHEVSRTRWNDAALRERYTTEAVLTELAKPDTKIVLFPVIPRPVFDGDHPKGAA